jgi:hypothetical protein
MKLSDEELVTLFELLDGLIENNLPAEKKKILEAWITESEEARKHYIRYMDLSSSLQHYAEERVSDETTPAPVVTAGERLIQFVNPWLPVAALLLFGAYIFFSYQTSDPLPINDRISAVGDGTQIPPYKNMEADSVAVLTRSVGLRWSEDADFRPRENSSLPPSTLKIEHGMAQVEFVDGAVVVLEGPADYELVHGNGSHLRLGKLRAHVPKVAVGFTVGLPLGEVVDLGTDFGIEVHPDSSAEVFVYNGKIKYQGQDIFGNQVSQNLTSRQAIHIRSDGEIYPLEMPSGDYLGSAELATRSFEQSQHRRSAWMNFSRKLFSRSDTRLYYGFDNHAKWDRVLKDETQREQGAGNGAVIGCNWTQGRWPGKGALQFSKSNDRVCLNLPGELKAVTMAAWVKLDQLSKPVSPLVFSRPYKKGAIGWSVNQDGQLILQVCSPDNEVNSYISPVAVTEERLGQWIHLATSYDSTNQWVSHFVNGRSFSREKIFNQQPVSLKKGLLGYSQAIPPFQKGIALHGCVDEFAIFGSAWEEDQIRELYEAGNPYGNSNSILSAQP